MPLVYSYMHWQVLSSIQLAAISEQSVQFFFHALCFRKNGKMICSEMAAYIVWKIILQTSGNLLQKDIPFRKSVFFVESLHAA